MNIFNEHTWWYLARASGIVAVTLLVMSVVWGIALSTRVSTSIRPAWTLEVHKWLSGLAMCATTLHLVGLSLDGYIDFGFTDLMVPGVSPYRPLASAVGIFTFYAMVAIQVTSWARKRLSRRVWHGVHMLAYAAVWGGLLHAGLAGTDTTNRAYQILAALLITVTALAVGVRVFAPPRRAGAGPTTQTASFPSPRTSAPASAPPARTPGRPAWSAPTITSGQTSVAAKAAWRNGRRSRPENGRLDPLIPTGPPRRRSHSTGPERRR